MINQKNIRKNSSWIIVLLICLITFLLITIFLFENQIKKIINNIFPPAKIETMALTEEEKLEDFDSLYETIISSFPNHSDVEKTYDIDFEEKYEEYRTLIRDTKNDFEFYCVMKGIVKDLASNHSSVLFPDEENIESISCYNMESVLAERKFKPYTEYWNSVIEKACQEYANVDVIEFRYMDGEYIYDSKWSDEKYDFLEGYHIVTVNQQSVDDYIPQTLSIYEKQYDSNHKKPYRCNVTLNSEIGAPVKVVLQNKVGESMEAELFMSLEMEMVSTYSLNFSDDIEIEEVQNIFHYYDKEKNILYIDIKNFNNTEGSSLREIFEKIEDETKIIIDFRENYGGNPYYARNFIYKNLYKEDIAFSQKWLVPYSKSNLIYSMELIDLLSHEIHISKEGVLYQTTTDYEGSQKDYRENIYYLIGEQTASAADEYISMVQKYDLGTVIGTNTAGEGLGGSFTACMLENSGIVYTYYPCKVDNLDGTNNGIYGTSPDIYIPQTVESFMKQRELDAEGIDTSTYESRLEWDNILIETINSFS